MKIEIFLSDDDPAPGAGALLALVDGLAWLGAVIARKFLACLPSGGSSCPGQNGGREDGNIHVVG